MVKLPKLILPENPLRAFLDRSGSFRLSGSNDKDPITRGSPLTVDSGGEDLELDTFLPNGLGSARKLHRCNSTNQRSGDEILDTEKDLTVLVPVPEHIAADDKRSDLEYELSQAEISLVKLQGIASRGLPTVDGHRATAWKLLLGYLPASCDSWERALTVSRSKYAKLRDELLSCPSGISSKKEEALCRNKPYPVSDMNGPLERHDASSEDHPLNLNNASTWHQHFQFTEIKEQIDRDLQRTHVDLNFFSAESSWSMKSRDDMRNILLLFAKLNPSIQYVQGMNEVLAPLYYVFSTDTDERNIVLLAPVHGSTLRIGAQAQALTFMANAEADSFSCFIRLLGDSVDHFCEHLDNSSVGIHSTLARLSDLLKANDEELWWHLEFTTQVNPQFYAFRWITLLLTQEFDFHTVLRIWDSLLSNPFGIQEMLLRVCCAMLLCAKTRLLAGDFSDNLKLLQNYPKIDIEHLLLVAQDITPSSHSLTPKTKIEQAPSPRDPRYITHSVYSPTPKSK